MRPGSDGGGGGSNDYEDLINKPQINLVTLIGNKTSQDLGLDPSQPDVFWATYGTTTASEISTAIQESKMVVCQYNNGVFVLQLEDTSYYYFGYQHDSSLFQITVKKSNNSWSTISQTSLQEEDKRVQSITGNEFSTIYYPSTKAVVDYVGKFADKVTGATEGNFAGLDSNGNLTDSGVSASDFATVDEIPDIEALTNEEINALLT